MISKRAFLSYLGVAPVAVPLAAKAALESQEGIGVSNLTAIDANPGTVMPCQRWSLSIGPDGQVKAVREGHEFSSQLFDSNQRYVR